MDATEIGLDPITPQVEAALAMSGMSQSAFGYVHFGDPAFITKMRKGRRFRPGTRDKIQKILEDLGL